MKEFNLKIGAYQIHCQLNESDSLTFLIQDQNSQEFEWTIIYTNKELPTQLPSVIKNTQKIFNYLNNKPSQRLDFDPLWISSQADIMRQNQLHKFGTIIIKRQICDQIVEIKLPIFKKKLTILDIYQRKISKLQLMNLQQKEQIQKLKQNIAIQAGNHQQTKTKLKKLIDSEQKNRQKYQKTIEDLKSKLNSQTSQIKNGFQRKKQISTEGSQ